MIEHHAGPAETPLPQTYRSAAPGIGGRIKVRSEDFLVDELPLYDPCGEGEHLYLGIEKKDVSHNELIDRLRRHFDVPRKAIGFAGMKDKRAITRQTVSIHLHEDPPSVDLGDDRIHVIWSRRHRNKLRRGHLLGNRFSIRVRDVDPLKLPAVTRTLRELESNGVPNYFGAQRFGSRANNHRLGRKLLAGDWSSLLDELLGSSIGAFPDHQTDRRLAYDEGRYEDAFVAWSPADQAERSALRALGRRPDAKGACLGIPPTARTFLINAFQSAVFNRVLDTRLASGTLERIVDGDLAYVHDRGAVFPATTSELADPALAERTAAVEVSPSGPLWGTDMTRAAGEVDCVEVAALESHGMTLDDFLASRGAPGGQRRSLRIPLGSADAESGVDEFGPYVRMAFDLPRGAYATVVTREIMKNDADPSGE